MAAVGGRWVAAAAVVGVVMVVTPSASAVAPAGELLPDLRQAPVGCPGGYVGDPALCGDWDVCLVSEVENPNAACMSRGRARAVRLRFTTAEDNVGAGPLLLYGWRPSVGVPTMQVRQAFQSGVDGRIPDSFAAAQQATATSTYYEPAQAHQHWHLMGFEHFELRTPGGGTLVADRKNGFCLGDRYATADAGVLPAAVRDDDTPQGRLGRVLAANTCNMHDPAALSVTQGISVGRGDDYRYTVDFQWLDITAVPSGTYDVVNTVNGDRTLRESDYGNNSSSIAISVRWPGGARSAPEVITRAPQVRLLRSCPGRDRCAGT